MESVQARRAFSEVPWPRTRRPTSKAGLSGSLRRAARSPDRLSPPGRWRPPLRRHATMERLTGCLRGLDVDLHAPKMPERGTVEYGWRHEGIWRHKPRREGTGNVVLAVWCWALIDPRDVAHPEIGSGEVWRHEHGHAVLPDLRVSAGGRTNGSHHDLFGRVVVSARRCEIATESCRLVRRDRRIGGRPGPDLALFRQLARHQLGRCCCSSGPGWRDRPADL